jgi:hypothetical protein
MDVQRRRFFAALSHIAAGLQSQEDRDRLVPYLQELRRAHRKFGVRERHYEVFRRDRDIYISGPDHMILRTAWVLRERGAPNRLIHYDLDPKTGQAV